jgi:hypothetical protein
MKEYQHDYLSLQKDPSHYGIQGGILITASLGRIKLSISRIPNVFP